MKFTLVHENPFWISQTNLNEHSILVRIESDDETPSDAARTGQRILDHVENNWDVIRQALVNDLLAVHNEEWADASHNSPTLSPADFLDKLTPTSINFGTWEEEEEEEEEEEDGLTEHCTVVFDDSNIFGGHVIQVRWNLTTTPISPSATIEG